VSLNAVAVELLIDKGGFEPRVALGIAEAIETSMIASSAPGLNWSAGYF
jgi:hypothetical protein